MPIQINIFKLIINLIKERIKHPFSYKKRHFRFTEPNTIYGLSDHPIDICGDPIHEIYKLKKKILNKKAFAIKECKYKSRENNCFEFDCNGYNVYLNWSIPVEVEEMYPLPRLGRKPRNMTLRIDFLQPGIYRVLCVIGDKIPDHNTEMVIKDIANYSFKVNFQEDSKYYSLISSELHLKLYKEDFKIKIFDKNNNIITES